MKKRLHNKIEHDYIETIYNPKMLHDTIRTHHYPQLTINVDTHNHEFNIKYKIFETVKPLPLNYLTYYIGRWNDPDKMYNATTQLVQITKDHWHKNPFIDMKFG